jgi:hypothetical protein
MVMATDLDAVAGEQGQHAIPAASLSSAERERGPTGPGIATTDDDTDSAVCQQCTSRPHDHWPG